MGLPLGCAGSGSHAVITSIGSLIHIYSVGYMKGEGGYYRFSERSTSLSSRCSCWCWPTTMSCCCRMGRRRPGELPLDRVLVPNLGRRQFRYAGVSGQSDRGRRIDAGNFSGVGILRQRPLRQYPQRAGRGAVQRYRPAAAFRGHRQIRSVPSPHLAPRGYGRTNPRVRIDPRRHHGHRGRVPHRPVSRRL